MKKKLLLTATAVVLAMSFMAGCGGSTENEKATTTAATTNAASKYYFEANGAKVNIGDNGEAAIAALGEANSTFTATSCAFEGEDHMYMYDAFQLTLSTVNGEEVVTAISVTNDMISTPEGVKIGSTNDDVTEAMGVESKEDGNYQFTDGHTAHAIVVKDDAVISITYSYVE